MTQKGILILISGLLLTGCLTGCNTGSANAAEQVSQQAGTSSLSAAAAPEEASLGSENSGAETSVPVFDFEKKTVFLNSGYEMPVAGLGTYALSDEECYNSVTALLENGGRLIDTASYYGNEESIGRAIRDSDVPREEIFVTTKIYPTEFDNPEEAIIPAQTIQRHTKQSKRPYRREKYTPPGFPATISGRRILSCLRCR